MKIRRVCTCMLFGILSLAVFAFVSSSKNPAEIERTLLGLVEKYYDEGDYETAGILLTGVLVTKPEDEAARLWLERITSGKSRLAKAKEDSATLMNAEAKEFRELYVRELRYIKFSIEELRREYHAFRSTNEISNIRPVIMNPNETDPNSLVPEARANMENGAVAYERGDYPAARRFLLKAVSLDPKNTKANSLLSACLYDENPQDQGNVKRSIEYAKIALEYDKHNLLALVYLGKAYETIGNLELAIINYLEALAIDRTGADINYRIGRIYLNMGEEEKAAYFLDEALRCDQKLPLAHYYRARIEEKRGNTRSAIAHLVKAVRYEEKFYLAHFELGECYFSTCNFESALSAYRKANSINSGIYTEVKIGDCMMRMKNYDAAENAYKSAVTDRFLGTREEKSIGASVYEKLAARAFEKGDFDQAVQFGEAGIALDDRRTTLYVLLGKAYKQEEAYDRAIDYFNKAIKIDETGIDARLGLIATFYQAGLKDKAADTLKAFLGKNPGIEGNESVRKIMETIGGR